MDLKKRKIFRNKTAVISLVVLLLYCLMGIGSEVYTVVCESRGVIPAFAVANENAGYLPPCAAHWFGTDYQGRDVLLRAVAGSATALKVGLIASFTSAAIGVVLGLLAGYFGGTVDDIVSWLYSTFAAMPSLLFILAFALLVSRNFLSPVLMAPILVLGKILHVESGVLCIYFAIGITGWVTLCRVVRAETLHVKTLPFVAAAKVAGVPDLTILFRHILPNVFHLVIIYFTLTFAGAVLCEVIVSYLGFGVQTAPSWGVMIADGQERLWRGIWWELACATLFAFFLVLSLNLLGDALRDELDSKGRERSC